MDKVSKKLPAFHNRLVATEWLCFALDPCKANELWVWEFYANLRIISFSNPVIKIQGKGVNFRVEEINDIYGLPNANMDKFEEKGCKLGSWMEKRLCLIKEVS